MDRRRETIAPECMEMKNEGRDEMSMFNHMLFYGQSVVSAHGIASRTSGRLKNFSNYFTSLVENKEGFCGVFFIHSHIFSLFFYCIFHVIDKMGSRKI